MNDIIKTFEAQCTDTVEIYNDISGITHHREFFDKEKFAELIVRECLSIVEPEVDCDEECCVILKGTAQEIKQHFGVEE